jgi:hypothetical protein
VAKNAEANLLVKIKQTGKEAITSVGKALDDVKVQAAVAGAAIAGFIGVTVKKYGEQEQAEKDLRQSLKAQGLEVDSLFKKYTDLASAVQAKTTMDDTAIIKGIALAQSFMGQLEITEELINATVDYAAATGTDLNTAFTAVGKTIGTSTNALSRQGVELAENTTAAQKMETVIAKLDKTWGGWAKSQRQGLGELKALGENIDDIAESIGKEFTPAISKGAKELNEFVGGLTSEEVATFAKWSAILLGIGGAASALVVGLATLGAALPVIVTGFTALVTAGTAVLAVLTGPIGIAAGVLAIAAAAATASGALDGVIEKTKKAFGFGGPEQREDGNYVDERSAYMERRSKAEMVELTKIADHSIAEERRARDERAKVANELAEARKKAEEKAAKDSIVAQQEAWEEMKKLKKDHDDEMVEKEKKRREELQSIYSNPVEVFFLEDKDGKRRDATRAEIANAGTAFAGSFLAAVQRGGDGAKVFGATIAEGFGNVIQEKLDGALGDDAVFGLGGLFKELFAFSAQSEEQIKAQTEAFVNAIPMIAENQVKFAPAMVEALVNALNDPKFWEALAAASGRMIAANTDALARQWGIESADEFIAKIGDGTLARELHKGLEEIGGFFLDYLTFSMDFETIIKDGFNDIKSSVFDPFVSGITDAFGVVTDWFIDINNKFTDKIKDTFAVVTDWFISIFDPMKDALNGLADAFKNPAGAAKKAGNSVGEILGLPGYASGGIVSGTIQRFAAGGTTDTVPAMLTPGEMVINRDATQKNLGLLQAINSGSSVGAGTTIHLTVNGGFLGDEASARQLARAIDEQLLKLRQSNQSVAFDKGLA